MVKTMANGYDPHDCEYAPLYEKYVLKPTPDADSDKQKDKEGKQ